MTHRTGPIVTHLAGVGNVMYRRIMWRAGLLAVASCAQVFGLDPPRQPDAALDGGRGAHIGGTVNGLRGNGLVLQDDGADDYPIFGDGTGSPVSFAFPMVLPFGSSYSVSVTEQPSNPLQSCTVQNGSGVANGDVANVDVSCATPSFTIGGNIDGLANSGLSLHNSTTGEDLGVVAAATSFTFATKEASGQGYNISIGNQPTTQSCSIFGGQGTVGIGNISNVVVNCSANQYVVNGNVTGLQGTIVLKDTNTNPADSDTVTVNANGGFAFTKTIVTSETYSVTVMANPTYNPMTGSLAQTCTPSNNSGTAPSVNAVSVACTTNTYTIGGDVTGLGSGASLVLQDNGADNLARDANGSFTFALRVASGSTYSVTILQQPATQTCTASNSSGTVTSNNVTNVMVTCN
jgi:hypothetical protein